MRFNKFLFFVLLMFVDIVSLKCSYAYDDTGLGVSGSSALSVDTEREIGTYFMTASRSSLPIIYDPVLEKYIQSLGTRLVLSAEGVKYPFEFFLVKDNSINAAAFFGGKVMVHAGLISVTDTESELASVLAHEITHVTQRHLARSIEERQKSLISGGAQLLGGLILSIINPAMGAFGVTSALGGIQQSQVDYTRSNEYEADRIGIDVLYRAGFNPDGMVSMMRKLQSNSDKISPVFEMLLTHPISAKRVAESSDRARLFKPKKYYESIDYQFAKARIRVRYTGTNPESLVAEANEKIRKNSSDYGAYYQKSLSLLALGKPAQALESLKQIEKKYPRNLFVVDTMSDILIAQKKTNEGVAYLNKLKNVLISDEVVFLNLASMYISSKKYDKAIKILKRLKIDTKYLAADEMLLDIYKQTNKKCEAYVLNAEIYEYKGRWVQALDSTKEALKYCSEKNLLLRTQAQQARIVEKQEFYDRLLKNL